MRGTRTRKGSLTAVGTGFQISGQVTPEALTCIQRAEKLFHLFGDPLTELWLRKANPSAESLRDSYIVGRDRHEIYEEIVARLLAAVRAGLDVCAVTYGHPGVFAYPFHEAIRRARRDGFRAAMLPGISAADCLFADLGVDPAEGCQMFEATDFLIHQRKFDSTCSLLLWQIGVIGVVSYENKALSNPEGLRVLAEVLAKAYSPTHRVTVYETPSYAISAPIIHRTALRRLDQAPVTVGSTLYVPPISTPRFSRLMARRIGFKG